LIIENCLQNQGLYLGSIAAACNKKELLRLNITHILSVLPQMGPIYPSNFQYKQIKGLYFFLLLSSSSFSTSLLDGNGLRKNIRLANSGVFGA
jgi:hypothetical protein